MKGIDIFCASQTSTSICMSMEQLASSSSSSSTNQPGGRAIDRHNPIIRRIPRTLNPSAPCSSEPPINPIPYHQLLQKSNNKKGYSKKLKEYKTKKSTTSASKQNDQKKRNSSTNPTENNKKNSCISSEIKNTPPGSTRYLLSDSAALFDGLLDYGGPVTQLVPFRDKNSSPTQTSTTTLKENEAVNEPDFLSHSKPSSNQVVVLRVSLHCKGCVGKVKKHLSRMEGVTSFNIDFPAKKVTIIGDVTPESVLESVSKVRKNAQFWPINSGDTNAGDIGTDIN